MKKERLPFSGINDIEISSFSKNKISIDHLMQKSALKLSSIINAEKKPSSNYKSVQKYVNKKYDYAEETSNPFPITCSRNSCKSSSKKKLSPSDEEPTQEEFDKMMESKNKENEKPYNTVSDQFFDLAFPPSQKISELIEEKNEKKYKARFGFKLRQPDFNDEIQNIDILINQKDLETIPSFEPENILDDGN